MKVLFAAAALGLLLASFAWSQQANVNLDWNPQKNTENLVPFSAPQNSPDVRDDRTVTFRLKAPLAKDVRLVGVAILTALGKPGAGVPFTKGEDGIWTLTVGPLRPDIYAYHFNVDGVQIADPSNTYAAFTAMPPYSQLVVHGDGPAFYDARNVPHGTVTRHVYHSDVTRRRARALRLHPARLRPRPNLPRALPGGRQRRAALELDLRRAGELHPRQSHCRGEGRADGDGRPQQPGRAQKQPAARGADLQALRGGAAAVGPSPGGARVLRAPRSQGPGALRPVDGGTPHDVRGVQLPGPVRLVRRAERGRHRRGEVARLVPHDPRRQSEDRLPLRRPGHGGGRGPHGRARQRHSWRP